jgi:phospholipase C
MRCVRRQRKTMHRLSLLRTSVLATATLSLAACSSPNDSGNTLVACRPLTANAASRPAGWRGTVFTIVMENQDRGQILGDDDAPYINALAAQGAVAAGYHDSYVHPSEPNYIWMVAGENFGILNDNDPGAGNTIDSRSHLADQIERAGLTWRAYEESMGPPCGLTSHDQYAAKHDPFIYFTDIDGWNGATFAPPPRCAEHIVDYSQLDVDIASGKLPDYAFITPNLTHDMHDGTVGQGDAWLAGEVPKILATEAYKNGGVLFLLWDEGSNSGDDPPFIALSPNALAGMVSQTSYDTSSFLLTVQRMLGVEALPCAPSPGAVRPMSDLFAAPL